MRPQDVVLIVKEVHRHLKQPIQIPIDVGAIQNYISSTLAIKFNLFGKVAWPGKQILGRLHRYEKNGQKSADIVVSESLNTCWSRFVACKELAHLLIDKSDDDCTHDPIGLVRGLVEFFPATIAADINSERCAIMAATELLIPWQQRKVVMEMIGSNKNNYEIALHFRVPEKVVEYWRSEPYQKLLTEAWTDVSTQEHPPSGARHP